MTVEHSIRKCFRLTPYEASLLEEHAVAADISQSDYVRSLICDPAHVFVTDVTLLQAIYRELKHQGVNLNQLAYVQNSRRQDATDRLAFERYATYISQTLIDLGAVLDTMGGARNAHR